MNFEKEFYKYKDEIIKCTKELVSINSVCEENEVVDGVTYPFGIGNFKALEYCLNLAKSFGFKTRNIEGVCGHVEYGEGDEIFAVLCHVDVVPAIGEWTRPPFECYEKDGKLYGRGTEDDKGPAIVSLFALKTLKDLNIMPKKRVRLIFGTDEESGSRGLKRYLEVEENPIYGISPDCDFPLVYGEKGICSIDFIGKNDSSFIVKGGSRYNIVAPSLEFTCGKQILDNISKNSKIVKANDKLYVLGKSAHAMEPDNGLNAIKEFVDIVYKYTDNKLIHFIKDNFMNSRLKDCNLDCTDNEMGDLTMNMGLIEMNDICSLGVNIRYPRNLDFDKFVTNLKNIASKYDLEVVVKNNSYPHYIDPNSNFIQTLYNSYVKYTNDHTQMKTIGGGTYARDLEKGVAYGVLMPNDPEMCHETDEFIFIDTLMKSGAIITDAIYEMTKDNKW